MFAFQRLSFRQAQRGAYFGFGVVVFALVLFSLFRTQGKSGGGASDLHLVQDTAASSIIPTHTKPLERPKQSPHNAPLRTYSQTLVIARTQKEDVGWIDHELSEMPNLKKAIYTVDDPESQFRVPKNKGHEVMVYLTYMIDNYESLSDVTMFMHSHLITWHNNDLLDSNAALMIKRLSSAHVVREGYMNMRCHLDPGCPDHLHPFSGTAGDNHQQPEEVIFAQSWQELFPNRTVPEVLSQPCCGQFALSKDKIQSIPRDQYIYYRDWVLTSKLPDNLSGRVWEYLWQVIFADVFEFCPKEHLCYCDGYGVCFGDEKEFTHWFDLRTEKRNSEKEREEVKNGSDPEKESKLDKLEEKIQSLERELQKLKGQALKDGMDPGFRAREVGRAWSPGDGF